MKLARLASVLITAALSASIASAQNTDPAVQPGTTMPQPPAPTARGGRGAPAALAHITPTPEQLASIQTKLDQLNAAVKALKDANVDDKLIAEAEVSTHFVGLTLRFPEEFFDQATVGKCLSVLDARLRRAGEIKDGGDPAADTGLSKRHNLQGPINDAFLNAFLCVTPTGQSANPLLDQRGKEELARFDRLMAKDYRGAARSKPDTAITKEDIADNNLVLFGDPDSNKTIAQIAAKLPIKWTKENIIVGDKTYSAATHIPVLIYPNPLNPTRYVVINTGLVPGGNGFGAGYGDYAILKLTKQAAGITAQTADGGVFDESWSLPGSK